MEQGRTLGPLRDMPTVLQHLHPFFEAFDLLSNSRPVNFGGVGPIPLLTILGYLEFKQIKNPDEQNRWIYYIQEMDVEFLTFANKPVVEEPKDGDDRT